LFFPADTDFLRRVIPIRLHSPLRTRVPSIRPFYSTAQQAWRQHRTSVGGCVVTQRWSVADRQEGGEVGRRGHLLICSRTHGYDGQEQRGASLAASARTGSRVSQWPREDQKPRRLPGSTPEALDLAAYSGGGDRRGG
jgi:hypothetical protein